MLRYIINIIITEAFTVYTFRIVFVIASIRNSMFFLLSIYFILRSSFWQRRTRMEKRLIVALVVTHLIAITFLVSFLFVIYTRSTPSPEGKYVTLLE